MINSPAVRLHRDGKKSGFKRNPKTGEVVSIAKSKLAKVADSPLAMWRKAMKKAGAYKPGEAFQPIKKGTAVYKKAKEIYKKMMSKK